MFTAVVAGVANAAFIFLKAFQQRNVAGSNYVLVIPTSVLMAACEVYVIAVIARTGYDPYLVGSIAIGGSLGCIAAMYIHDKVFGRLRK